MKTGITVILVYVAIIVILVVGEVKCIIKAVQCNWEPIGKAEIFYTAASITGFGAIAGYIDIQDK
jgi:hypothetical protein